MEAFLTTQLRHCALEKIPVWKEARKTYRRLDDVHRKLADEGLMRHIKACDVTYIDYNAEAVKEIVTYAEFGILFHKDDYDPASVFNLIER